MSVQIYFGKKNPKVLNAERFFKERKIPFSLVDLNKHKLGKKELELFIANLGNVEALIDRTQKQINNHSVALLFDENLVKQAILKDPTCLRSPIIRNGNKITLSSDINSLKSLIE